MRALIFLAAFTLSCNSKTALDVESCLTAAAANAAAPLLGDISADLLAPDTTPDQVKQQLLGLATTNGVAAVMCALDTVLRDLGGNAPGKGPITGKLVARRTGAKPPGDDLGLQTVQRALDRGRQAREALLAQAQVPK
jgi:hypothetical protein